MWAASRTSNCTRAIVALVAAAAMLSAPVAGANGGGGGNGARGNGQGEPPASEQQPQKAAAEERKKDGRGTGGAAAPAPKRAEKQQRGGGSARPSGSGSARRTAAADRGRDAGSARARTAAARPSAPPSPAAETGGAVALADRPEVAPVAGGAAAPVASASRASRERRTARRAARRSRRTPRPPRTARILTARMTAAPAVAPVAAPVAPAARRAPATKRPARERERRGIRPAIGATVERLVEVVPDWLLALLGALGALTLALGALSAVTTLRASRSERQRRRLTQDIGLLQSALLPVLAPQVGATAVSAAYRPADGPGAGGDFYDAFELPGGRTGVIVGDVEGHGRRALPLTALVRYTVRAHMESGLEPRLALQAAGAALFRQLGGHLVTVVAAIYDPVTGHLTYACAGHPQPILLGTEHTPVLATASPPIGAGPSTGHRQVVVTLPPGAAAVFYTDGLADVAPDSTGARIGFDGLAERVRELGPETDAEAVLAPLARGSLNDDMTACVLRPLAEAAAARPLHVEQLEVRGADLVIARSFLGRCGIGDAEADAAVREARSLITTNGIAIVEVQRQSAEPKVAVRAAEYLALPLRAARTDEHPSVADASAR